MLKSLSDSTLSQYNAPICDWFKFCTDIDSDPLSVNAVELIRFLTKMFDKGASYGTINSAKSAICLLKTVKCSVFDKIVSRFLKGVFRMRPPKAKYNKIWDISPVLTRVESWFPLMSLNLTELTNRLIILMALGSPQRLNTLASIKISNVFKTLTGYEIKITELTKTSRPGSFQPLLSYDYFLENPKLCIASTLEIYLEVTKPLRKEIDSLFITTKKPHKAASTATISRWIKNVLALSGIHRSYGPYSVKHASTSAALKKGLHLDIIKNAAGWSRNSQTFFKFYNRPIESSAHNYAASVLQK